MGRCGLPASENLKDVFANSCRYISHIVMLALRFVLLGLAQHTFDLVASQHA